MRLKNWLLTGTSITMLAFAPVAANAQSAELQSAYSAYVQAQASGDAAALEAAQTALTELCIVEGFASIDECIAALSGAAPAAEPAVEEPAPAEEPVAEEPPPVQEPVVEEPAVEAAPPAEAAPPVEEAPAVEEPVMEEPAPEAAPAPEAPVVQEAPAEAAPAAEQPVAEEPVVEAPAAEEPAVVTEEPAATSEQPAAEQPVVEEPAPTAEETAPAAAAGDIEAQLAAHVDAYNAAVADLAAGVPDAQARIDAALAEITAICGLLGYTDNATCTADFGLTLSPLPEAAPAEQQPAAVPADPAAPVPGDEQPAPVEETTSDGQPAEMVEELPPGVTPEQIAPVFDSAKDASAPADANATAEAGTPADASAPAEAQAAPAAPTEPAPPAPTSDAEAQAEVLMTLQAAPPPAVTAEAGTAVAATGGTTVEQTIVNNTVNNITNNITNINTTVTGDNNTVQTGVQQTPVTVVEAPVVETDTGSAIAQLIVQVGTQLIINSVGQDTDRFYDPSRGDEIYYEDLSNGRTREVITRPDGTQIVTVRNRNGDILRRSRITPDGREYVLAYFDDRYYDDLVEWRDPAADLPPLRLNIPVQEYVLDSRYADENELTEFFAQPPVENVARLYSIDEVKRSARLRDSVRRLEVGNLTFDTGAATIGRDQVQSLSAVANAMLTLLERNPNETFLIEGHTDAVGSDVSNLRLSDMRAATVARVLTDFYGVPPENLATQGYGERYLKIRTEAAERENRRATIRRITPLITVASN
ncbi:OmpA family protein [Devosia sediminis]|uniref:OmpA family protein n=1 Tax=Devosia sediminis TaxID=2798801 RepID=A0A934IMQ8_9HYPH|nr:OmpA family protein [Devosia sediminis]MBJ3783594.1 OmpA family protein [Devosia sediminis]